MQKTTSRNVYLNTTFRFRWSSNSSVYMGKCSAKSSEQPNRNVYNFAAIISIAAVLPRHFLANKSRPTFSFLNSDNPMWIRFSSGKVTKTNFRQKQIQGETRLHGYTFLDGIYFMRRFYRLIFLPLCIARVCTTLTGVCIIFTGT